MIPKRSLLDFMIAVVLMAAPLTAQSDPIWNCRERASNLTNATMADTSAHLRGGLDNGDDIILWKARLSNGHIVGGLCVANPLTGRIVRFGTDQDSGIHRAYRMTPDDAERVCQREARENFSPGNVLIDAEFLPNTSTKSIYRVGWRYYSMGGTIRKGHCEIDSATGSIRKFDADLSW